MKLQAKTGFILLMSFFALLATKEANAQAGATSVPFLLISPDARASGMGEVGTGLADDINAIYWNTAGLAFLTSFEKTDKFGDTYEVPFRQVALAFSPWLPQFNADLYYSYGTFGQHIDELDGTIAVNFIFMNLGEFTRTNTNGDVLGKFISNEFTLGLSYGTLIMPDLGWGIQLRYIQSNLTPTSSEGNNKESGTGISGGFDLGLLWKPSDLGPLKGALSLGANLQNVGPKITYKAESDPLPTNLRLGTGLKILGSAEDGALVEDEFSSLTFAADFAKVLVKRDSLDSDPLPKSLITGWERPGAQWSFGVEYWYSKVVALRAGYFTEPVALGNRQYYNFGAGVKYDIFKLDFSFINTIEENHPLANTMRFSLLVDWE